MALAVWFRTPHPTMPNFVLSADETSDLIAYILSLQSDCQGDYLDRTDQSCAVTCVA